MLDETNNNLNDNSQEPINQPTPANEWQTVEQASEAVLQQEPEQAQPDTQQQAAPTPPPHIGATVTPFEPTLGTGAYVSRYPSESAQTQPSSYFRPQPPFGFEPEPQRTKKANKEKKKNGKGGWMATAIVSMVCTVVCASLLAVTLFVNPKTNSTSGGAGGSTVNINQQTVQPNTTVTSADGMLTTEQVVEKILPSVVEIDITTSAGEGGGSGVIMTEDGYVLTNAHVLESALTVKIVTNDGVQHEAKVIAYDTETDVGVAKMEGTFTAATFGDSTTVVPGEEVVAIGTPYSSALFQTVTKGIVSAKRDALNFSSLALTLDVIQHDAAINSGNSGGPLVNMYGQVVGINSVKMSGLYENLSFALQINKVLSTASELISKGAVEKPMIGITGRTEPNIGGVLVVQLTEGGAAIEAGLQVNDVITKINDTRIKTIDELTTNIRAFNIGDQVTITAIRDGEMITFTMSLRSSIS